VSGPGTGSFGDFVARAHRSGRLVVQPRMGVSDPVAMRAGLLATKSAAATTVGTITLDSYTRMGDNVNAQSALASGIELNGYPIVAHDPATTRRVLDGVVEPDFPVQVRHGSPCPEPIVAALIRAGLHATEIGVEILNLARRHSQSELGAAPDNVGGAHRPFVPGEIDDFGFGEIGAESPAEVG